MEKTIKRPNREPVQFTIEELMEAVEIINSELEGSIGRFDEDGQLSEFGEPDLRFYLDLKEALNRVLTNKYREV